MRVKKFVNFKNLCKILKMFYLRNNTDFLIGEINHAQFF